MRDFPGKSPSLLSDDHLRAIGAIIVNWNAIELVMEILALGIYQIPLQRGLVFTVNLGFQNKLTILRIVAVHGAIKDPKEQTDFLAFMDRIDKAHIQRNTIGHAWWAGGKVQGLAKRMALRVRGRKISAVSEQVPLSDLEAMATSFLMLHDEMVVWTRRLGVDPDLPEEAVPGPPTQTPK